MRRWMMLATLLALLVAACGGGGGQSEGESGDQSDTTSPAADGEDAVTDSSDASDGSTGDESTLAGFMGWDAEVDDTAWRDQEARVQEAIRVCMAGEGFEYVPILRPDEVVGDAVEEFDEKEWAREQGFGITTWYGNEELGDDASGRDEWVDPNQESLDAMSDGERQAWHDALYGTEEEQMEGVVTEVDPETGEEYTVSMGHGPGCSGESYEAEYGDSSQTQDLWADLEPAMTAMYERVSADPRMVELEQQWSACMSEAGYDYESPEAMQNVIFEDFQGRLDEIVGPNGGYIDPFEGWTEDEINAFFEEKTQEEIDAFFAENAGKAREDVDMEALEALQAEEIEMAVADVECRGDYWEVYQEVSESYEADFIAENRQILEQIREVEGR